MKDAGAAPSNKSNDEREIVTRAQRGDVLAFEALYHAHSGRMFALCLRMSGDRDEATELVQDVFVRIWERLGSFRGEAAFSTWAHRLAVNVVLEGRRKNQRRETKIGERETSGTEGSGDGGWRSEERGVGRSSFIEERLDLENAIARLSPGLRRVFVLHDIEGYQHNEIARMTGSAEGTLRAQLHQARKILMEALER